MASFPPDCASIRWVYSCGVSCMIEFLPARPQAPANQSDFLRMLALEFQLHGETTSRESEMLPFHH
jgi:hypothetical protein